MKQSAPPALRNRQPIAEILESELPESGLVLEIASGTGEHAVHFARAFPALQWQPTDPDETALASIAAWREEEGLGNVLEPLLLDAASSDWPVSAADAMLCINMIHISPWEASEGLFAAAGRLLPQGAPLVLYGPYFEDAVEPAESNLAFDRSLQQRNQAWGIRRIEDVDALAEKNGLKRMRRAEMPANNLTLVYRKM